mgnify:FL=1
MPYSLHSSFSELVEFVSFIRPETLVPINPDPHNEVNKYLSCYCSEPQPPQNQPDAVPCSTSTTTSEQAPVTRARITFSKFIEERADIQHWHPGNAHQMHELAEIRKYERVVRSSTWENRATHEESLYVGRATLSIQRCMTVRRTRPTKRPYHDWLS